MLTDVHISNASQLLRQQFPQIQGLQSPVYGQALTFQKAEAPFVQIVHTGGSHWSTIAGAPDSTVKVYDSLFPGISLSVKMQAAAIIRPERSHLLFEMERTQFQQGGADCGLFAIAYAVDYCYGNNPATKRYHQGEMRQHLLQCVQKGALTPFPSSSVRCSRPVEQMRVRLHCDCRLPEDGEEEMAYCPCCRTWFHKSCQNIADIVFSNEKTTWKCSHCS